MMVEKLRGFCLFLLFCFIVEFCGANPIAEVPNNLFFICFKPREHLMLTEY